MFKKHPKGLIAAALANMGERFGFYIMMAILTLFISAKFGLSETTTGYIYSAFYASIYILALVGGVIADKTKNFKGTILSYRMEKSDLYGMLQHGSPPFCGGSCEAADDRGNAVSGPAFPE